MLGLGHNHNRATTTTVTTWIRWSSHVFPPGLCLVGGRGGQGGFLVRSLVGGAGSCSVAHRAGLLPTELIGMWSWILLRSPHQGRGRHQPPPPLPQRPGSHLSFVGFTCVHTFSWGAEDSQNQTMGMRTDGTSGWGVSPGRPRCRRDCHVAQWGRSGV